MIIISRLRHFNRRHTSLSAQSITWTKRNLQAQQRNAAAAGCSGTDPSPEECRRHTVAELKRGAAAALETISRSTSWKEGRQIAMKHYIWWIIVVYSLQPLYASTTGSHCRSILHAPAAPRQRGKEETPRHCRRRRRDELGTFLSSRDGVQKPVENVEDYEGRWKGFPRELVHLTGVELSVDDGWRCVGCLLLVFHLKWGVEEDS